MFSPAKVNLYLRILGKRADGYHALETVMVPLTFGDDLILEPQPQGITLTCDDPGLPTDDTNLVVRAAKRLQEVGSVTRGARIRLRKRIPLAAGLAGGSSNAAATLRGLDQLWGLHSPPATLHEIAAALGSDINFFLQGQPALCCGRGEQVQPLPGTLPGWVLLVNPGFGISTRWAYQAWAAAEAAAGLTATPPEVTVLAHALAQQDLATVGRSLYNSLEAPSLRKFPVLRLLKETMQAAGAVGTLMSGSGATVFGLFAEAPSAATASATIRARFGPSMWTEVCRSSQTSEA